MTEPERAAVRVLIDRAKRERLNAFSPEFEGCKDCGCEYDSYTAGCVACGRRHYRRRRWRRDAAYREDCRLRKQRARDRAKEAARTCRR